MRALAYPLLLIAGTGFLLSLTAHVLALFGIAMPGGGLVWMLHVGIFVVWIPTVLFSKRMVQNRPRKDQLKAVLANCPVWMGRGVKILFAYAMVNFLWFLFSTIGQPKHTGPPTPAVIRGISGHWMIFYAFAFVTFYSIVKGSRNPQFKAEIKKMETKRSGGKGAADCTDYHGCEANDHD